MRVLMLSGDPKALDANSDAGKRTEEYRRVLGEPASPAGGLYILVARGSIFKLISAYFESAKIIKEKQVEIITAQDTEHAFLAWCLSRKFNIPWQMQIHTDIFNSHFVKHSVLNKIRVWLAKFLLPRAGCVRVVSERIKNSLTWRFHRQVPIVVLPIFVDVEKIKNAPIRTDLHQKYGKDKFIILMASRITKEKNIKLAIEAFMPAKAQILQDLAQRGRREQSNSPAGEYASLAKFSAETALLLIVGDGPELQNLKSKVRNEKLDDFVKFEPHTDDLASYYKTCDLFLLTSNYEGYGMTLIEAAAAGAKIISTDAGIAPEILEPVAICKVGDKNDLIGKLTEAFKGTLPPPKLPPIRIKEGYLDLYKKSFEICLKQYEQRKYCNYIEQRTSAANKN